jgi:hypothetical protein
MEIDMQRENTKIEIGHYDTTWSHGQNEEHEAIYSYYRMQEYGDMKINNVIFGEKKCNLCQEHTKIE